MNHLRIISDLEKNKSSFFALLSSQEEDFIKWKPSPEKWNLLEIVCHLHDEEREDFRARVKHTLETPELPLPSIDPVGWVTERKYAERSYEQTFKSFLQERDRSIEWLKSLGKVDWKKFHIHPKFGNMSAEMFLSNWLAHDYLHMRQILSLKFHFLQEQSGESLNYAGNW
jgi:hypothetical protein